MTVAAAFVLVLTLAGWAYVVVLPRAGIWRRTQVTAVLLIVVTAGLLWRAGELGDAVGKPDPTSVLVGLGVGVIWVVVTQIGHAVLCRLIPSFVDRVRDLYSITTDDRRRDVLVALVSMALAEEFVFRLVAQREFGIVVAVVAYTLVQAVERNWALMLAGAAFGVVWGLVYAWRDGLAAPLIAHVVWTGTLTPLWPLRGCHGRRVPEADVVAITGQR